VALWKVEQAAVTCPIQAETMKNLTRHAERTGLERY
jgi:hypothetical protein